MGYSNGILARYGPDGWDPDPNPRSGVNWIGGPLIVHHSVYPRLPLDATQLQIVARAVSIDNLHESNGWIGGFGYNFGIISGQVIEGRGAMFAGAHTVGYNSLLPAVVVDGNYASQQPRDEDLEALLWLARHLGRTSFTGHRDYNSTSCPGNALYAMLNYLNRELAKDEPEPGEFYVESLQWTEGGMGPKLLGGWSNAGARDQLLAAISLGETDWGKYVKEQGASATAAKFQTDKAPYGIILWEKDRYNIGTPRWGPFNTKSERKVFVEDHLRHLDTRLREFSGRQYSLYSRRP